ALAQARRAVHGELAGSVNPRDQAIAGLEEWATVTVLAAAGSITLPAPAPAAPGLPGPEHTATRTFGGLLARDPGEFVGRRADQHDLPRLLPTGDRPGVVLHGIGGIGKTTLAAETLRRTLDRDPGRIVVTLTGPLNIDGILTELTGALRRPLLLA